MLSNGSRSVLRIERLNLVIGAIASAIAFFVGTKAQFLGVVVGVVLTSVNFWFLRRVVFRWTAEVAAGRPTNRLALLAPKMIGMMAAVGIAVLFLPISVVGFTIGYSVFIASIIVESIYLVISPPPDDPDAGTPSPPSEDKTDG